MKNHTQVVFLVQHSHKLGPDAEDVKIVGVFSTDQLAKAAIRKLRKTPGFKEQKDGFHTDRYLINQVYWEDGFFTLDPKRAPKKMPNEPSGSSRRRRNQRRQAKPTESDGLA